MVAALAPVWTLFWTIDINHLEVPYSLHVKNSTSLTENVKVLLNLYISTLLVLKVILMLILLRPAVAGCPLGGTEATTTLG